MNKKLIALGLGTSAAALAALITAGTASSDPAAESPYNVVGEPYGRAVQISPLAAIVALLAGAQILGILGALIAIPVAAAIGVVYSELRPPADESPAAPPPPEPAAAS